MELVWVKRHSGYPSSVSFANSGIANEWIRSMKQPEPSMVYWAVPTYLLQYHTYLCTGLHTENSAVPTVQARNISRCLFSPSQSLKVGNTPKSVTNSELILCKSFRSTHHSCKALSGSTMCGLEGLSSVRVCGTGAQETMIRDLFAVSGL